jgi:hypothetical protein
MTDRHAGYIVTLSNDIREDDAEAVITALKMVKGVVGVEPVLADSSVHVAEMRIGSEVRQKLYQFIQEQL